MPTSVEASGARGTQASTASPPRLPAFLMGVGLGGFIDGIVLHQLLQWHHILTDTGDHPMTTISGLEDNTLADGVFHTLTWFFVAAAMLLTVRAWQRRELAPPWRSHFGMLLVGWGVFNLVEGLIDHQILGIHHVRDDLGAPIGWDLGFLALGALLVLAGLALSRSGECIVERRNRTPDALAARSKGLRRPPTTGQLLLMSPDAAPGTSSAGSRRDATSARGFVL